MTITEPYIGVAGVKYIFEYNDAESFDHLNYAKCRQVRAICFCEDKVIIGLGTKADLWGFIGGTIESGERFEKTLKREIEEESNTEVVSSIPIGYQKCTDTRDNSYYYQLRYVCKVRKIGNFIKDPAGGIKEVRFVEPWDYKKYFSWGKIGERMMARALELKSKL